MLVYWTPWMKRVLIYGCGAVAYGIMAGVAAANGYSLPLWVMAGAAIAVAAVAERVAKPRARANTGATHDSPETSGSPPLTCPVCGEPTVANPAGEMFCRKCQRFVG